MSDLREGLDSVIRDLYVGNPDTPPDVYVEAVVNYIRQHDDHAEFVREVQSFALVGADALELDGRKRNWLAYNRFSDLLALCAAELAKEQNNG